MTINKKLEVIICMGSACFARGNTENLEYIENYIKENKLEAYIEITGSRCESKCDKGPNIIINGIEHHNMSIKKLEKILKNE
jgi:NADH:ubiquinone oxidoreductase subunit E